MCHCSGTNVCVEWDVSGMSGSRQVVYSQQSQEAVLLVCLELMEKSGYGGPYSMSTTANTFLSALVLNLSFH